MMLKATIWGLAVVPIGVVVREVVRVVIPTVVQTVVPIVLHAAVR
jgi:hypothetical protein